MPGPNIAGGAARAGDADASASPARAAPPARTPTQEVDHTHTALAGFAGIRARSRKSAQREGLRARRDSPDLDQASAERTRAPTGTSDPHGSPTGLISVMAQWIDGGESNIHSICETLRSCVEAGELVKSTPLHLEIEACAASRPSVSLRGGVDKYQAHLAQFKKVLASLQRGAGRALRRRSLAALQNCTVVAVLEPRLYAFEVSLAWSHMGAEYRVALFSKLKSKDWPNPASLLGSLAEILHFLHTSTALHTAALELNEALRTVTTQKANLEHDLHLARDAAQVADARAQRAGEAVMQLRETLQARDEDIAKLVSEDKHSKLMIQIQKLQDDNLQLAADLAAANTKAAELQQELSTRAKEAEAFKAEALARETTARNAYNESLKFFEQDCKAKLEDLDTRYSVLEDDLVSERLISAQLRAKLVRASAHVSNEVEALTGAVAALDHVLSCLADSLTRYLDSTREAEQSVDTVFQKKIVRSANARYAAEGAYKMLVVPAQDPAVTVDALLGRPLLQRNVGGDNEVEKLMHEEFSMVMPVFSKKYGGIESALPLEWEFVVEPRKDVTYPGQGGKIDPVSKQPFPSRVAQHVDVLLKHEMAVKAKLVRSEVIALRLFTGAAHEVLNAALRNTLSGSSSATRTTSSSASRSESDPCPFLVTVTVLNSAITKLLRVTGPSVSRTLYRGLQDLCMPEDLLSFGPGSTSAFVERAFASCSTRKDVALQYAGPCNCSLRKDEENVVYCSIHKSTLLQISTGAVDCGAWLGWVSQYPEEDEYCLPAGSFFEVTGVRRERHANVFEVSFRDNRSGVTLDVLREQRKTYALNFGNSLLSEAHQLLTCTPVLSTHVGSELARLDNLKKSFMHTYAAQNVEWFNSIANYQNAMNCIFDEWKSILESACLVILAWLCEQQEREATWTHRMKRDVLKMNQMALLIMQRCANGEWGAKNIRVLQKRLADLALKYGSDLQISSQEAARYWRDYGKAMQQGLEYPEALRAFEQEQKLIDDAQRELDAIKQNPELMARERMSITKSPEYGALVCVSLCRIANLHRLMGDDALASKTLEDARARAKTLDSKYHPVVADVAQAFGLLYYRQTRTREALLEFEESLRIKMVHLSVQHESVKEDLEHIHCVFAAAKFDKVIHRFRALERFFWIVTNSSNPHRASSNNDMSVKEVLDYMRAAKKLTPASAEWGLRVLTAALECVAEVPDITSKVELQVVSETVCSCMLSFCGNQRVQGAGLRALLALFGGYQEVLLNIASTALDLQVVWRAMASHLDSRDIQESGLRILRGLADREMTKTEEEAAIEAFKSVPAADADVVRAPAKTQVSHRSVLNVVVAAMRRHKGDAAIQHHACAVLLSMTSNSSVQARARIALEAKDIISEIMDEHASVQHIVSTGSKCLELLAEQHNHYEAFSCRFWVNDSAENRMRLELAVCQTKIKYLLAEHERVDAADAASEMEADALLSATIAHLNTLEETLNSTQPLLVGLEDKVNRENERTRMLQRQLADTSQELDASILALQALEKKKGLLAEGNAQLTNQLSVLRDEYAALGLTQNETSHAYIALLEEIEAQKTAHLALEGTISTLQASLTERTTELQVQTSRAAQVTAERDQLEGKIAELTRRKDEISDEPPLSEQVEALKKQLEWASESNAKHCAVLQSELEALKKQLEEAVDSNAKDCALLQSELEGMRNSLSDMEAEKAEWETKMNAEKLQFDTKMARDTALWAAEKARESERRQKIQTHGEEIVKEAADLLDALKDARIEIKDVGKSAVQNTMRGYWETADTRNIIDAMLASPACLHTQEIGCATLWSLCQGDTRNEIMYRIANGLGVKAVIAAMKFMVDTVAVQECGCAVLCALAIDNEEVVPKIYDEGGVEVAAEALKREWTSAMVVQHGLGFLRAAASLVEYRHAMAEQVALVGVVEGIQAFRGKALVAEYGLSLLGFLLTAHRGNAAKFVQDTQVPEAVLASMKNHPHNPVVQECACNVLHELTNHGKSILDFELQTEAIRLLLLAVDTHKSNDVLIPSAIRNLIHLTHTEQNAAQVSSGGGIARIVGILSAQNDLIQRTPFLERTPSAAQLVERSNTAPDLINHCFLLLKQCAYQTTYVLIARQGAISAVIQSMMACKDNASVQIEGTCCLTAFAGSAANSIRIVEGDAVSVVSSAVAAFQDNLELQDAVFELLDTLADHAESVPEIINSGGVECILDRLKAAPQNEDERDRHAEGIIVGAGLLVKLASQHEHCDAMASLGAVTVLLNGIRIHQARPSGEQCLEEALKALMTLAASAACRREIGASGGVELVFEVFKSSPHAALPGVLQNGMGLLWNLAYESENLALICSQGGLEWVINTMRKHGEDTKLLERGCSALWNFACTDENQAKIAHMGGISVIVKSMRHWLNHRGIQENGRGALRRLTKSVLSRILEFECDVEDTGCSATRFSRTQRNARKGHLNAVGLDASNLDSFQWKGVPANERTVSPAKVRPGACVGTAGPSSPVEEDVENDRSDVICFVCTRPSTRCVEVLFQDFRVSFIDFSHQLATIFSLQGSDGVVFVYTWMGVPTAVTDSESFHTCKERIEDFYCGRGDQALSISVYRHNELCPVLEAVTTAVASVQTPPEFMPIRRGDDEHDSSGSEDAEHHNHQENEVSNSDSGPPPDAPGEDPAKKDDKEAAGNEGPPRKLLGSIKLRHTVQGSDKLGESLFPYYADSDVENLEKEAEEFVSSRNIPSSHIQAIVQAALAKRENALAAGEAQASRSRKKKDSRTS